MNINRNVLTIAAGKKIYVDFAVNLAYSFLYWHTESDITFYIVTDVPELIPASLLSKVSIITIQPGELGEGFSPKLHLDELAPEGQTIFIDSDCLIFEKIDWLFDRFKGHHVSVIGGYISSGEWFGDIAAICTKFNTTHIPKFNGGLYYLEKGDKATAVYKTARALEKEYDEIGLVRLRGRPNDELLMALAMQLNGEKPYIDDGTVMSDPQACQGGYDINVISGKRWLLNPDAPHPMHQDWYPFKKVSPAIVHFLGYYTQHYPYLKETYRLKRKIAGNNPWLTEIMAALTIQYPLQFKEFIKTSFRPLYHRLFGIRKIKTSERIV